MKCCFYNKENGGVKVYLLMNEKEKIVLNTIEEFGDYNLNNYKVYSLVPADQADLVNDGQIRDAISRVLKGNEITKDELIERVNYQFDIPKTRITKVITKMKKEGTILTLDDLDYMGNRLLWME